MEDLGFVEDIQDNDLGFVEDTVNTTVKANKITIAQPKESLPPVPNKPQVQELKIEEPQKTVLEGKVEKNVPYITDGSKNPFRNERTAYEYLQGLSGRERTNQTLKYLATKLKSGLNDFRINHPILNDLGKNMGYIRPATHFADFLAKNGINAGLSDNAKELGTDIALSIPPALNILSAGYTTGLNGLVPAVADSGVYGLTSAVADVAQGEAEPSEILTRPLTYAAGAWLPIKGIQQVGKGLRNAKRSIDIGVRRNTPLADRMMRNQELQARLDELTAPEVQPSQYGVADINSAQNEAIAKQMAGNIEAENQLMSEYRQVHSNMVNKYGSVENLKAQAVKDLEQEQLYGVKSEALEDYRSLLAYEQELQNAKYVNTNIKNSATRETPIVENQFSATENGAKTGVATQEGKITPEAINSANNPSPVVSEKVNPNFENDLSRILSPDNGIANKSKIKVVVGDVSDKELNVAAEQGIDLNGYKHNLDYSSKKHVNKKHSGNGEYDRGQIPITDDDFKNIPEIIYNADEVTYVGKNKRGMDGFRYKKEMPDGTVYYIEEVRTGKKTLTLDTMYKQKKTTGRTDAEAPITTSETSSNGTNSITNSSDNFNPSGKVRQLGQSDTVVDTFGEPMNMEYKATNNQDLIAQANAEISANPSAVQTDIMGKKMLSDLDFEKGRQLITKMYNEGNIDAATKLTETLVEKATEAGRAVQALSLWSKTTPAGILKMAENAVKKYNASHPKARLKLTKEQKVNLAEQAKAIEGMEEGYDKQFATAKMLADLGSYIPADAGAKIKTFRNIMWLLNGKTFARNLTGNSTLALAENAISKNLAVPVDMVTSLFTGKRSRVATQVGEYFKGLKSGVQKGNKEVLAGVNTRNLGGRFDIQKNRVFKTPVLSALETATDWSLRVPDTAFYEASFNESVANQILTQMKNNGVKNPKLTKDVMDKYMTPEIIKQAQDEALEMVFQNNGVGSAIATGIRKVLNIPTDRMGLNFGLGDLTVPYSQTPGNIGEMTFNYSPLGIGRGLWEIGHGNQRMGTLNIARGLTGTGAGIGGYLAAKNGFITPNNVDEKTRYNEQVLGIRPNQIVLPNGNLMSYEQIQPISGAIAAGAGLYGNEGDTRKALDAVTQNWLDMSVLKGVNDFTKDLSQEGFGTALANVLAGTPQLLTSGLINQVNSLISPNQKETYDPNLIQEGLNKAIARTPVIDKMLPDKVDVTGQTVRKVGADDSVGWKLFNTFLNPVFVTKPKNDMVMNEIVNLYNATGENKHMLPRVDKKVPMYDSNGNPIMDATSKKPKMQKIPLDGKGYTAYQKKLGNTAYTEMAKIMQTPMYQNSDEQTRVEILANIKDMAKAYVDNEMFNKPNRHEKGKTIPNPVKGVMNKINKINNMLINNDIRNYIMQQEDLPTMIIEE